MIKIGLEKLLEDKNTQKLIKGNAALLCHSASVAKNLEHSLTLCKKLLGKRLIKVFGPQHGFVSDVQDNMIETSDFIHPYFNIPVHSLYGETRRPTDQMLSDIDTVIVDLQDVGTRVYTYITTLSYVMEECAKKSIRVIVLDRPNPVGGELFEGPVLENKWRSFVGHHPIPQRHSLTIGEIAKLQQSLYTPNCDLKVVSLTDWKRDMSWNETQRIWVNPSPNLATKESAYVFPGSVLFEGTNISEGRGTTRALEVLGAPGIEPFSFCEHLNKLNKEWEIEGAIFKPHYFMPMFQKHSNTPCGGVQICPTSLDHFQSWRLGALLLREFYHQDIFKFQWNSKPYEYENDGLAIDYINGGEGLRKWVEKNGTIDELIDLEQAGLDHFLDLRDDCLLYS